MGHLKKMFAETKEVWWPKLVPLDDSGTHRQASWLELFFDLAVVACIGQISHGFAKHINAKGFLIFTISIFNVFFVWGVMSIYSGRYETQSLRHRLIMFLSMVPLGFLAVASARLFEAKNEMVRQEALLLYGLTFLFSRLVLMFAWEQAAWDSPHKAMKKLTHKLMLTLYTPPVILIVAGLLFYKTPRITLWIWVGAIAYEQLLRYISMCFNWNPEIKELPPHHMEHAKERHGLLSMLILGEIIISSISGVLKTEGFMQAILFYVLSMGIVILLWWHYYDFIANKKIKPKSAYLDAWRGLHGLIGFSLLLIAAILEYINSHGMDVSSVYKTWLLGAVVLFLFCIHLSNFLTDGWPVTYPKGLEYYKDVWNKRLANTTRTSILFILALSFATSLRSDAFLGLIILVLMFNSISGFILWVLFLYKIRSAEEPAAS